MQTEEIEPRRFRIPGDEVHGLDRAPRGPLHQVVERGDRDYAARVLVEGEADVAVVRARKDLRLGEPVEAVRLLHDPDERLLAVRVAVDLPQVLLRDRRGEKRMTRRENPPNGFDCMTGERGRHGRLLLDLRGVAVAYGRVRPDDARPLRMSRGGTAVGAPRGRARLRIDDDPRRVDQARL